MNQPFSLNIYSLFLFSFKDVAVVRVYVNDNQQMKEFLLPNV